MMNYKKGDNIEEELTKDNIPIEGLPEHFLWMQVKGGTKVSNVIDFAKKAIDTGEHRSIVWTGSGGGITKTISCAEIIKRSYEFHQVTQLCYQKVEEFWDPITAGLEQIVASRKIPCIHIFLSLDDIDPKTPGYQHSKNKTEFWDEPEINKSRDNKKNNRNDNRPSGGKQQKFGNFQNRKQKNYKDRPRQEKSQDNVKADVAKEAV